MFSFRYILRVGAKLALTRESINLHQISPISMNYFEIPFYKNTLIRTKTNLSGSSQENVENSCTKQPLGKLEGKLKVMFTCKKCKFRNGKIISKVAYEHGIVIIRCDGCKNNHLIADNIGWFPEMRKTRNIEKFLAARGETVKKVQNDIDGYIEIVTKAELDLLEQNKNQAKLIQEESEICIQKKKADTSES
ncbi:PREDICTED: DNL-type zinc finger protein-like [Dufourea novaeangliae]|uniref:DNL-type zinc finger protein n=1 Tax=Dufourea novaeangliae TaxID=178035 RepID=A0A154PGV7_DUFNO|nr:PREDICTED: DNL-type zinc finger protein-like [Dufourea novaeangliae]KZC11116.1 DNL-type zinc finger protein [Dufourea novaeangliae]